MSLHVDPNPLHWSPDVKTISGILVMVITIVGSTWKAADYIGGKIYAFAEGQTAIVQQLKQMQGQLTDAKVEMKTNVLDENAAREKSLAELKQEVVPRIDKLEGVAGLAATEAAAAKVRIDDMKADLTELKASTTAILNVTKSHDADIKATRRAVAPVEGAH